MSPCTLIFGPNWPHFFENADLQYIFNRSASAVTPSEKSSIITNSKSTMCFPMCLRWTSYVASKPPKEGLKNAKWPVLVQKVHFSGRKSATKCLCLRTVCDKVVIKEFIGLSTVQNGWWGTSSSTWNLAETYPPHQKRRISIDIRS